MTATAAAHAGGASACAGSDQLLPAGGELPRPREYVWDNFKGLCVLFVVLIHCVMSFCGIDAYVSSPILSGLVGVLVFVVMPGFTFVSGHLSSAELTPRRRVSLIRTWVVALLQQALWMLIYTPLAQQDAELRRPWLPLPFWSSGGVVWFLLCLALWRSLLPLLSMFRWPVTLSVVVSTLALFLDSSKSMVWQPAFTFLPFFMAGYSTSPETLRRWSGPAARRCFLAVLALAAAASGLWRAAGGSARPVALEIWGAYACLYGDIMKQAQLPMHCTSWAAPLLHLAFLGVSFLLIPGLLACVPRRQMWGLTRAGAMSLYVYLLHIYGGLLGAAALALASGKAKEPSSERVAEGVLHGPLALPAALAYGLLLWACLAHGWVRCACRPCVEPRLERWLLPDPEGGLQPTTAATAEALAAGSKAAGEASPRPSVSAAAAAAATAGGVPA